MGPEVISIRWTEYWQTQVKRKPRTLTVPEFSALLKPARDIHGMPWVLRIMLAVVTGLRQQDIDRLTVEDIMSNRIAAMNRKAHKFDEGRPMHDTAAKLLRKYIEKLPTGQVRLWPDKYHHDKWGTIKERAGLPRLKFHALRASCASFVLQKGFSTSVAQDLLDHSTPILTHEIYANLQPVYQDAVNAIPLDEALRDLNLEL